VPNVNARRRGRSTVTPEPGCAQAARNAPSRTHIMRSDVLLARSNGAALALRPPLARIGLALAVVAVALGMGAAVVDPRFQPLLAAAVALAALGLSLRFPIAATTAALVFAASVFYDSRFEFAAGPTAVHPSEALLGVLLAVVLVRPARLWWGGFAGGALLVFLGWVALATALAVWAGRASFVDAASWARPFGLLAFFYVIVRIVPDARAARRVLAICAAIGALSGAVAVLVALTSGTGSFLADPSHTFITSAEGLGIIERVRFPGLAFGYLLFWYTVARALDGSASARWWWRLAVVAVVASLAVSFNRNMWIGLVLGFPLMFIGVHAELRRRVAVVLALLAVGIIAMVLLGPETSERSPLSPLADRASTVLTPSRISSDRSLLGRGPENERAWEALEGNYVTGIGAGVPWGSFLTQREPSGRINQTVQLFLHNQYLYLLIVGGVPALLAFLAFLVALLWSAWSARAYATELRSCGVGFVMLMVSSAVMISFSTRNWTAAIGVVGGAAMVLARAGASGEHPRHDVGPRPAFERSAATPSRSRATFWPGMR
jgi:O-antigen ligase